jgi:hypothetical protein
VEPVPLGETPAVREAVGDALTVELPLTVEDGVAGGGQFGDALEAVELQPGDAELAFQEVGAVDPEAEHAEPAGRSRRVEGVGQVVAEASHWSMMDGSARS